MLLKRLIHRLHWFYTSIVKEKDEFMVYFYIIFAHSMFLIFYAWGIVAFSGFFDPKNSKIEFAVIGGAILLINLYSFFKDRDEIENEINQPQVNKYDKKDLILTIYILGSLLIFIGSMVYEKLIQS